MLKHPIQKVMVLLLLAIGSVLGIIYLDVYKENSIRIGFPIVASPDCEEMAFCVVPRRAGASERQAYILKLGNGITKAMPIPGSRSVTGMGWRPGAPTPELFVTTHSVDPGVPSHILAVTVSDGVSVALKDLSPDLIILGYLGWNPRGQILATSVAKIGKSHYLAISYDKGRDFVVTDIAVAAGKFIWTDDDTLYAYGRNVDGKCGILELDVYLKKLQVSRIISPSENARVVGKLDDKVVYRLDNDIYCADELIYHSNEKIGNAFACGSYVAFQVLPRQKGSYVSVIDRGGNIISKKKMVGNTIIIELSSVYKFVYLLKDLQSIQRYNFVDNGEISTIYKVTD